MNYTATAIAAAGLVLWSVGAHAAASKTLPSSPMTGCWRVVDPGDPLDTSDPDEVLCMNPDGPGTVRESVIYGEGVKGCSRVRTRRGQGTVTFVVDYTSCTNDAPSHDIVCRTDGAGRPKKDCKIIMHPPRGSGKPDDALDVRIVPEVGSTS